MKHKSGKFILTNEEYIEVWRSYKVRGYDMETTKNPDGTWTLVVLGKIKDE